jgi:amino acid adenylation domain-containing protein
MLEDARPLCVITAGSAADVLPAGITLLRLDDETALAAQPETNPERTDLRPEHPAYVIYTSGSTGRPKGVVMPHGNLANLIRWQVDRAEFRSLRRVVQFAALGFDVAFQEKFSTLCSGGSLFLIHEEMRHSPAELMEFIREKGIERLFLPYVALQSVAEVVSGSRGKLEGADKRSPLKEIITAGEQLRVEGEVARFFNQLGDCSLKNQYGPTESHVASSFELSGKIADWPALPPIGRPIWNTQVYVLDGRMRPVPVGVSGELYIAGSGLARGYLNSAGLTSERFIASPYGEPGSRMYRTGDVARYRADGNLEYLGRTDDQVKIRGFRIELGEIESALSAHASIGQSVLVAREDEPGDKRLVAYVVASEGSSIDAAELRSHLGRSLPEYMVPSAFVELESLPLSPNWKLDRKQLPAPEWQSREYEAPVGETEPVIAAVFAEVLKLKRVGREDHFFELGGHSLLATRLISQLRQKLQVELPLRALFEAPTVKGLAESALEQQRSADWPAESYLDTLLPLRKDGHLPPLFCIHPAAGVSLPYAGLLPHIPVGHPVYGLQVPSYTASYKKHSSIEDMVSDYLALIRSVCPAGPYLLLGWSFGGLVAFEVATQLEAAGETVALVALLDSYPAVEHITYKTIDEPAILEMIVNELDYREAAIPSPTRPLDRSVVINLLKENGLLAEMPLNEIESFVLTLISTLRTHIYWARRYRPTSLLRTELTLFVASHDNDITIAELWEPHLLGLLDVYRVPTTHAKMMQPAPLAPIGATLAKKLEELFSRPIEKVSGE